MIYGIAPGGDQGEPDKEIELQQKAVVKPTKRISPTQSEKPAEADSNLISPNDQRRSSGAYCAHGRGRTQRANARVQKALQHPLQRDTQQPQGHPQP